MATCVIPCTQTADANQTNQVSELALVARAREGDEDAFAALFDLHKKRVYSLCLRMTGSAVEAEDLTQDAFIQVFRKLATFRGDAAFSTWLYRVVVNTVLMKLRRRSPRQVSIDEPVRLESSAVPRDIGRSDPELMGAVDRIALDRAIEQLPAGCRTIFLLHEVQGYEHHEIARMLHCSVGNSKSQLHKARLKIRELLISNKESRTVAQLARQKRAELPVVRPAREKRIPVAEIVVSGYDPFPMSSWAASGLSGAA